MRARVVSIETFGTAGARLITDDKTLDAERIVIAAGAWSVRLLEPLGIRIPLESQRGYHVMVADADPMPSLPVVSNYPKMYATPMEQGLRLAGTVEFAGLEAAPNYRRAQNFIPLAKEMFPDLTFGPVTEWMGHRPCLPDSLPAIGTAPAHPSLILAFGHGHHGLTGASTTGRLIAEMIANRRPCIDPIPYKPERF